MFNRRKKSKQLEKAETVDIEQAVKLLIERLQEENPDEEQTPEQLSAKLSGILQNFGNSQLQGDAPDALPSISQREGALITLTSPNSTPYLTIQQLQKSVLPFISAIETIQHTLCLARQVPPEEIQIISMIPTFKGMGIRLKGGMNTFSLLQSALLDWKKQNSTLLEDENIPQHILQSAKSDLSIRILNQMVPHLSPSESVTFSVQMQPALDIILSSEWDIASVRK
jgi:hypothetical protein